MKRVALTCTLASAVAAVVAFSAAPANAATGPPTLDLSGPKSPGLLDKVTATGTLPGGVPGEQVTVTVQASGRTVDKKQVGVGSDGGFSLPFVVDACCAYEVTATSGGQSSQPRRFTVRVPKHLRKGAISHLYNQSLVDEGYYTGGHVSGKYNHGSQLATLAFRKVNNMARNYQYKPVIFKKLLQDKGAFRPRYHSGHHVEVDISRQVMALMDGDKVSRPSTSPPESPRRRQCGGRTTSTARTPATTPRGCTTRSTSSAGTRPTATTRCRCTRPRATGASGTRFPSRPISTTGSTSGTRSTSTDSP